MTRKKRSRQTYRTTTGLFQARLFDLTTEEIMRDLDPGWFAADPNTLAFVRATTSRSER